MVQYNNVDEWDDESMVNQCISVFSYVVLL